MPAILDITIAILRMIIFIVLYIIIGFGPGFIIGLLVVNATFGKGKPLRMDSHITNMKKAAEHNKQWDPKHERWQ